MLIKKAMNEKFLKVLFAVVISYYFGLIILQYNFKAIAVLGVAIFLIIFLTKIEYAIYFLLASRGIVDILYGVEVPGNLTLRQLLGVFIAAIFLFYIIVVSRYNIFNVFSLGINKIYGIFLFFSIFPVFLTENLRSGFGSWLRMFQGFLILNITILLVLSAGTESYKKRINIICWFVIISLFIPYIIFLKKYIQGEFIVGSGQIIRYTGFLSHYNIFSYLLLIVLPFCLFLYSVTTKNSKKILWLIFMAIIIFTIGISYTRNVWIGLVILLVAWNIFRKNFKISLSIIGFSVLMIIFDPTVQDRLEDIYVVLTSKNFFELDPKLGSSRIGIWQANIRYFIDHSTLMEKLFGNGFDIRQKIVFTHTMRQMFEHNNYLTLLMTTGICGLSIYLLYILKLFRESFKLLKRTKEIYLRNLAQVFTSLLLAYVILSATTHILWNITFQYYFSVFAGFIIAANILEKIKYEKS